MHAPLPFLSFPRLFAGATSSFWLASCVEAFLRGSDVRSQVLMARSGLLQHLVDGVLNTQGSGNLQVTPVAHASFLARKQLSRLALASRNVSYIRVYQHMHVYTCVKYMYLRIGRVCTYDAPVKHAQASVTRRRKT